MSKYQEYAEKPTEFLALTGYTRQEFDELLPHFKRCYDEWMKSHRLDGKPRGKRKYSDYKNSPLPTQGCTALHYNYPFLCWRIIVVKTGGSNSRALICWVRPS